MFGYIRPLKSELLVRQWNYYQSAYCGLCKEIGRRYGQLPRLALTYDMTFLVVMLQSLTENFAQQQQERCLANPVKSKLIMQPNNALEYAAAATVILTYFKGEDDRRDGRKLRGGLVVSAFTSSRKKAARDFPELNNKISEKLQLLNLAEMEKRGNDAADLFGEILADIFSLGLEKISVVPGYEASNEEHALAKAVEFLGRDLGRWIYLIDAIDDLAADMDNGDWNLFSDYDLTTARKRADEMLSSLEKSMDKTAMLITFERDSSLIANIIRLGMPHIRSQIIRGDCLGKL